MIVAVLENKLKKLCSQSKICSHQTCIDSPSIWSEIISDAPKSECKTKSEKEYRVWNHALCWWMIEFEMVIAENVKLLQFFEMAVVLRSSDVRIFIMQFHGINIKPNAEFQFSEIYLRKVKISHDFKLW